jgi:hypothetical protein
MAAVYENAGKKVGLTQTASYTASITQQETGAASNIACVTQAVNIDGSTNASGKKSPVTVTLEAHQSVKITQDSIGSGGNIAQQGADATGTCTGSAIAQSQTLTSTVTGTGSITQLENDAISACGDGVAGDNSNMCLDIEQNQGSGNGAATGPNNATFTQTNSLSAIANTPAGPVTQTQSSADTPGFNGGLVGTINQYSTGQSTASATQNETQCEDAAVSGLTACHTAPGDADFDGTYQLTQNQYGPEGVWKFRHSPRGHRLYGHVDKGLGASSQTGGNTSDSFTINQTSTQDNDQGTGSTQTNTIQGDCSTPGTCTDTQNTNINGTTSTNTQSGQSVNTQTTCSGSTCTSTGPTTTGTLNLLPNGLSVSNTDIGEFGAGDMRGTGTGSIPVSGISGHPVFHAFLYWHGPTNSTDPNSNASVNFNGTPVTGTNIGTANDNNWGFMNSQSYRADVTGLITGDGAYSLSNFIKTAPDTTNACSPPTLPPSSDCVADINGVALIVFYDDGNASDDRNIVLWNGNDSNQPSAFDSDSAWNETISGVQYPGSGSARLDMVVGDGQSFDDGDLSVNNVVVGPGPAVFQGDTGHPGGVTGSLWDVKSFDITSVLSTGSNNLNITSPAVGDALSLVVAIANVPVSAPPVVIGSPTARRAVAAKPAAGLQHIATAVAGGGAIPR